jgi:putative flippase GtrA
LKNNFTDNKIIKKIWNREVITYLVAGVLTTVVNYIVYYIFCNMMGIPNLIANAIAWIAAVLFAYIVNDIWVFQSKKHSLIGELQQLGKFLGARIVSFLIEETGMFVLIDVMKFNNLIIKGVLAVIVILLNYIFSKLFVFNKN